ncbi:MAG TPA: hypothetical protein VF247_00895 [Candidatus Krumholzibacteria bacterium]
MRIRDIAMAGVVFAASGLACSSSSGPSDPGTSSSNCVTDLSCGFNQECNGGGCGPITPALRSHIQTASCLMRAENDANETSWRAGHFDLLIAGYYPDDSRAVNPNIRLFEYMVARFNRFDLPAPKTAMQWASSNGFNGEDFYLHFKEDTYIPTWEGKTIVPGFPAGMVPGWVPGGPVAGASATSRDQSRVVGYYYGPQPWYFANVANPGYRAFLKTYMTGAMNGTWWFNQTFASGAVDGIMIDDAIWYPKFGEGLLDHTTEYYGIPVNDSHPYTYAIENIYPALASDMLQQFNETKDIMPNYGHVLFLNYNNRCAKDIQKTTPWIWGEVWVTYTGASSPVTGSTRCMSEMYDYDQGVKQIVLQTRAGGRRILGARDPSNGTAGSDRGKMMTLGMYYLVHNAHTYYMYESAAHNEAGDLTTWGYNPLVEFDVGQPDQVPAGFVDFEGKANTKEHYLFASGTDPSYPSLTYHVYARKFTNALVLVKLMPINGTTGGSTGDSSITIHALDGTYAPLQVNGTLGAPMTQAQIRNNEALILVKL